MGCCILGALIFGFLLRSWRSMQALVGIEPSDRDRPNAALWRPGLIAPVPMVVARPSARYSPIAAGLGILLIIGIATHHGSLHTFHGWLGIRVADLAIGLGLPASWVLPICTG